MRSSDWSSDVCSSDLEATARIRQELPGVEVIGLSMHEEADTATRMLNAGAFAYLTTGGPLDGLIAAIRHCAQSARALDRQSVAYGKRVSVRVDLGGRSIIKKNKNAQKKTLHKI